MRNMSWGRSSFSIALLALAACSSGSPSPDATDVEGPGTATSVVPEAPQVTPLSPEAQARLQRQHARLATWLAPTAACEHFEAPMAQGEGPLSSENPCSPMSLSFRMAQLAETPEGEDPISDIRFVQAPNGGMAILMKTPWEEHELSWTWTKESLGWVCSVNLDALVEAQRGSVAVGLRELDCEAVGS